MKVAGCVFHNKKIITNTSDTFEAYYKGHHIYVSSDHGLGKPRYDHLTRFNTTVTDNQGNYAVFTYVDTECIYDAIREALYGACLVCSFGA